MTPIVENLLLLIILIVLGWIGSGLTALYWYCIGSPTPDGQPADTKYIFHRWGNYIVDKYNWFDKSFRSDQVIEKRVEAFKKANEEHWKNLTVECDKDECSNLKKQEKITEAITAYRAKQYKRVWPNPFMMLGICVMCTNIWITAGLYFLLLLLDFITFTDQQHTIIGFLVMIAASNLLIRKM